MISTVVALQSPHQEINSAEWRQPSLLILTPLCITEEEPPPRRTDQMVLLLDCSSCVPSKRRQHHSADAPL